MTAVTESAPAGQAADGATAIAAAGTPAPAPHPGQEDAAVCSLCGTQQAAGLMVSDGGPDCPDVRWYCKDVRRCTWRWTAGRGESR
jgi:hypothetical protein